jgi:hypothetical protein
MTLMVNEIVNVLRCRTEKLHGIPLNATIPADTLAGVAAGNLSFSGIFGPAINLKYIRI